MANSVFTDKFRQELLEEIILPDYKADIKRTIGTRYFWSYFSIICTVSSTLMMAGTTIVSFLAVKYPTLIFVSGIFSVVAIALKQFSFFCDNQDKIKTIEINKIMQTVGINLQIDDDVDIKNDVESGNKKNPENPITQIGENPKDRDNI